MSTLILEKILAHIEPPGYGKGEYGAAFVYRIADLHLLAAGDLDGSGLLDVADIDRLSEAVRDGSNDATLDLNIDSPIDRLEHLSWIRDIKRTRLSDANLDGPFGAQDLMDVAAVGTYEKDVDATWSRGDFNADGVFNSDDLIEALADGGYESGLRPMTAPKPAVFKLLGLGLLGMAVGKRRKRCSRW